MSLRVARKPIVLPSGVDAQFRDQCLTVRGKKGDLSLIIDPLVHLIIDLDSHTIRLDTQVQTAHAISGTLRALVQNMVLGVSQGFEKRLTLIGVGYRAQMKESTLSLTLGFSHPIEYVLPKGITAETPTQTLIIIRGMDKALVGQVAAEIRAYRPPEPYKGKGVRYENEQIVIKETKKK
jgi:large subunit ribosomal protein L6